ncbi:hypothetical protein [Sulfuricaulis sp.]|jgi:hypothetical protein|uniref:hypothetical protein n=1 Tax=Sulfuricaulis sp. TaxID=2003553 RepID=UPI003559DD41
MTALSAILGTLAVLILVPVTVLLVQVLMALPAYRPRPLPQSRRFPVGILIPAHDEAAVIAQPSAPFSLSSETGCSCRCVFSVTLRKMAERACQKLNTEGGSALAFHEEPR